MNVIAFAPAHASKSRPGDAREFQREAREWLEYYDAADPPSLVVFDNSLSPQRRGEWIERALEANKPEDGFEAIAFFCHGLRDLLQTGHAKDTKRRPAYRRVESFAETLARVSSNAPSIALYACDAARDDDSDSKDDTEGGPGGDGGFADELRDAMLRVRSFFGGWIDAHATPGHTTLNPFVRRFDLVALPHERVTGRVGGDWIVDPDDRERWRSWRRALGTTKIKGAMRLAFPTLTRSEIHEVLSEP